MHEEFLRKPYPARDEAAAPSLAQLVASIYQASSDPGSSVFLPIVLLEQWPGADPWSVAGLTVGDLAQLEATLPSQLCALLSGGSIASPPSAILTLTQIQVGGLANATLAAAPVVQGSQVTATVSFGGATAPPGLSLLPTLQVSASFAVALACCPSADGTSCSSSPQPASIAGTLTAILSGGSANLTFQVAPDFTVTATAIAFTGTLGGVAFEAQPVSAVNYQVSNLLTAALATPAAQALVGSALAAALGQPAALASLGQSLTPILQSIANPTILSYVASRLYQAAVDPTSALYLPKQVMDATNPTLEPFSVQGGWTLDDVSSFYPAAGMTICGAVGTRKVPPVTEISSPGSPVAIQLSDIQIAGLSNVGAFPLLTVGDDIEALIVFGQLSGWPKQFVISGNFTIDLTCCVTTNFKLCSGPPDPQHGWGTFAATVTAASASAFVAIGVNGNALVANVTGLRFRCDANLQNPANVSFDIEIQSVPAPDRPTWNAQVEKLLNAPQATEAIVAQIQQEMNTQAVLTRISTIVTEAIANILTAGELDALRARP